MLRPAGYSIITEPEGQTERDNAQCGHCQRIIFVKPGTAATVYLVYDGVRWIEEAGAGCRVCMRPICLRCLDIGTCIPWERKFEVMEARARFLKSAGLG